MNRQKAVLLLQDKTVFKGYSFGAEGETIGEVVFNTSLTGYQEVLSDPSYKGQIVLMTYPHIGNYGINKEDMESGKLWLEGFIVRECCRIPSNYRSEIDLHSFLKESGVVSIEGIDTRKLTRHIRDNGAQPGIISTEDFDIESLHIKLKREHPIDGKDLAAHVTCLNSYSWNGKGTYKIAAYDFGIKHNILRLLQKNGFEVQVFPANHNPEFILNGNFDGVFLSNGPGDPEMVDYAIKNTKLLLGKLPVFGICLGHQILGLALGGKISKLPFGHHGGNQPVMNMDTGKVEITAQNHNFVVNFPETADVNQNNGRPGILQTNFGKAKISHINLNDKSNEGIECIDIPAFSVQYHPEAAPGPHDSSYLFEKFVKVIGEWKKRK